MHILEAVTTVEVPIETSIKELGTKRAMQFIKEITEYYTDLLLKQKGLKNTFH